MIAKASQKNDYSLNFGKKKGKELLANFEGGQITSDAGIVMLAELDKKLKIIARFAECFQDHRNLAYKRLYSSTTTCTKSLWHCFRLRRCQ